jgi:hypothetical protein
MKTKLNLTSTQVDILRYWGLTCNNRDDACDGCEWRNGDHPEPGEECNDLFDVIDRLAKEKS